MIRVSESWLNVSDTSKSIYLPSFTSFRNDKELLEEREYLFGLKKRFTTKVICRSNEDAEMPGF